jgi:hypothetical protein
MERVWLFEKLAVAVMRIDFVDPAVAQLPDARERGVRIEIRPVDVVAAGSVYASPAISLQPALCRIDLLESRPRAGDRMHWHPAMAQGEPDERVFDRELSDDPRGWVASRLRDIASLLPGDDAGDGRHDADAAAIAAATDEIVAAIDAGLAWARGPWPVADHDERGMAPT